MRRDFPLLLLSFLTAFGCGKDSNSSVSAGLKAIQEKLDRLERSSLTAPPNSRDDDSAPPPDSLRSEATKAIERSRVSLDEHDWPAAYDMLLAAMRRDPSLPEVFQMALDFLDGTTSSDDERVGELAHDVLIRLDALIPFQPVDQIAAARQSYNEVAQELENQGATPAPPIGPIDAIQNSIARAANPKLPLDVRSLLLQRSRSELENLALDVTEASEPIPDDFWNKWQAAKSKLDETEGQTLGSLYAELHARVSGWHQTALEMQRKSTETNAEQVEAAGKNVLQVLQTGYRLRRESLPFVEGAVVQAIDDQKALDDRIEFLERTREWLYNQQTLNFLGWLNEVSQKELTPLAKLQKLANYDERRLSPYILQKYQDEWNKWFEECDDAMKVEAAKARVVHQVTDAEGTK
jgi:hypothetical protein